MEIEEVVDRDTLTAYLKDQPAQASRFVSTRAALVFLPVVNDWTLQLPEERRALRSLVENAFRSTHISWISSCEPNRKRWRTYAADAEKTFRSAKDNVVKLSSKKRANELGDLTQDDGGLRTLIATNAIHTAVQRAATEGAGWASAAFAVDSRAFWKSKRKMMNEEVSNWLRSGRSAGWRFHVNEAVWSKVEPEIYRNWSELRTELLAEDVNWRFWTDWYDRRLAGSVEDMTIHRKVAEIEAADWDKGAAHVNAMIAGWLEAQESQALPPAPDFEALPQKEKTKLVEQVEFLMATGAHTELSASALSEQMQFAINEFCRKEMLNRLPEELEVVQHIATTLDRVARTVSSDQSKEEKIEALQAEILRLRVENEELLRRLSAPEHKDNFDKFIEAAYVSAGKVAGPAILTGSLVFVARFVDPGTLNALALEAKSALARYRH